MKSMNRKSLTLTLGAIAAVSLLASGSVSALTVKAEPFQQTESPWDMSFLKDGTMFFTEKCKGLSVRLPSGSVNRLLGVGDSSGYSQARKDLFCDGQAGVQGVEVDPEFNSNRFVYLYSSSKGPNRTYGGYNNIVMRMKVSADLASVSDVVEIISDIGYKPQASNHPFGGPGAHNGGRLRFNPGDGFLYVTTGDNHNGPGPQSPTEIRGKVLRVDRDGKAAAGNNPPPGFDKRVFAYGFRNPQGIAFRPGTNEPYISENGPWHSDEVTKLVNGGNGGWDPRGNVNGRPECPDNYCGYSPNQMGAMEPKKRAAFMSMTDTKAYPNAMRPAWNNNGLSQGMCGSVFLVGKQWKQWEGRLAVGYAGIGIHGTPTGNRIDILDISKDGKTSKREEVQWPTFAGRFRHMSLGPDGALYVADEGGGMIYRVTPN
ncbi:MAG: PQQ-dependent sugar dehydrogenase [Proteobacteria bacterium]|nr:PQQ-dependent sugar dehydrogenase [Pseudomonadota bacterium]MDA0877013.1 PQQ-dependent sugar dehydrogenase [Pseudomonadota bacterium]MDA1187932.1 PQQ-dependent sugar dehydrogenase [Pseudomonadota bacterium]